MNAGRSPKVFRRFGLLIFTALVFLFFALSDQRFCTPANLFIILREAGIYAIMALGLTAIVSLGEFDISFPTVAAFVTVFLIYLLKSGVNLYLAWMLSFAASLLIALIASFFVVDLGVNSFITSLGVQALVFGLGKWLALGGVLRMVYYPPNFDLPGARHVFHLVPFSIFISLAVAIVAIIAFEYTPAGRFVYAVGINHEAARHAGIKVKRIKRFAYLFFGATLGIAGIVMASMFGQGSTMVGKGYLFPVMTACFLGAAFLRFGRINSYGTVVACLLLAIFDNGLVFTPIPFGGLVRAIILLVSIGLVSALNRRRLEGIAVEGE